MAFKYRERSPDNLQKRATQQGGDFAGFIRDDIKTWSPKKGDNWIRILPPTWDDAEHYALEVHVHYRIGPERASVICNAKQHGTKCRCCEARVEFERAGDEKEAGEIKAAKRVMAWIIDRNEPDKGPQVWAMPWTVDRDICKIQRDKRSGEIYYIDHPTQGYDVMFDKEGDGQQTKYAGFQLARKPSSVDERDLDYITNNPLTEVLIERSYAEVKALYEGGMPDDEAPRAPARRPAPRDDEPDERRGREAERAIDQRRSGYDDDRDPPPRRRDDDEPPRRRPDPRDDDDRGAGSRYRDEEPPRRRPDPRDDEVDRYRDDPPPRRAGRDDDEPRGRRDDRDDRDPPPRDDRWREELDPRDEPPPRQGTTRRSLPPRDEEPRDVRDDREEAPRGTTRRPLPPRDEEPRRAPPRDEEPPFDGGQPARQPATGSSRAAQLRERFANRS